MRTKDHQAFTDAAKLYSCWILVRAINPGSIPYLDDPHYTPKPIDCKPKTADLDLPKRSLSGLVIVPAIHGAAAFKGEKFEKATSCWSEFLQAQGIPPAPQQGSSPQQCGLREAESLNRAKGDYGVDLDPGSKHYGCLLFRKKWIHGDYDLKDIILAGQECRNLAAVEEMRGQRHMRGPLFFKIAGFVNRRLGKEMIQHGGEAQFSDHTDDFIDVFGPRGQHCQLTNLAAIADWYRLHDRDVIQLGKVKVETVPDPAKTPQQYRAGFRVLPGGKAGKP